MFVLWSPQYAAEREVSCTDCTQEGRKTQGKVHLRQILGLTSQEHSLKHESTNKSEKTCQALPTMLITVTYVHSVIRATCHIIEVQTLHTSFYKLIPMFFQTQKKHFGAQFQQIYDGIYEDFKW